jgi:hypothetical protein
MGLGHQNERFEGSSARELRDLQPSILTTVDAREFNVAALVTSLSIETPMACADRVTNGSKPTVNLPMSTTVNLRRNLRTDQGFGSRELSGRRWSARRAPCHRGGKQHIASGCGHPQPPSGLSAERDDLAALAGGAIPQHPERLAPSCRGDILRLILCARPCPT